MSPVIFEQNGAIATITLNRPDKLNAFNREMALQFQEALRDCQREDIRCVIITGAGKGFSAGQDLAEVIDPNGPGMDKILSEQFNPVIQLIQQLQKPVIAAVNGVAAGAGANIALACDLVVAASSATFIQAFSKIGLIPDSGGTYFLPRLIGRQRATAIMMLGDKISAEQAEEWGMIYKSFEDTSFYAQVEQLASTLSAMPTKALAYTKKALQSSAENNLETQLRVEDKLQQQAAASADFQEGVLAFIEKRKPVFTGK